ncbi:HAD-like protein [Leucogyrophana mollusca]|uniref:HAD-like protein n=1 Tax=Leucogyrophana mollusca TaxID=85980 RepID=A0ACB8B2A4_9AGAM|nr:HAD-like protein [Leucogyrophana mollusca]
MVSDPSSVPRRKIEYVIFDMDGLLIDTERVYTEVTNDILAPYGKTMTWDIKAGLMGKLERDAAELLLSFFPDIPLTVDTYLSLRRDAQDARWPTVQPLPGARRLIKHLHAHNIPIALATASQRRNLLLKTAHLGDMFGAFGARVVCADDVAGKTRGKPEPYIFLCAARERLGRGVGEGEVEACGEDGEEWRERARGLVFEDAIPGVEAGKRAGMSVVWVPDANLLNVEYSGAHLPDQTLKSLEEFVPEEWGLPPYDETQ